MDSSYVSARERTVKVPIRSAIEFNTKVIQLRAQFKVDYKAEVRRSKETRRLLKDTLAQSIQRLQSEYVEIGNQEI